MYDPKCFVLALEFLSDHPDLDSNRWREALAQKIQDLIEDWIEGAEEIAIAEKRMSKCQEGLS